VQSTAPTDFSASYGNSSGPILSRDDAYRRLAEAADYLARTEPHSPTPYLVRRAIAWGGMRLEDLLPELVRNSNELGEICRLLQIEKAGAK
jgi:predicted component of type VI protein secretion system